MQIEVLGTTFDEHALGQRLEALEDEILHLRVAKHELQRRQQIAAQQMHSPSSLTEQPASQNHAALHRRYAQQCQDAWAAARALPSAGVSALSSRLPHTWAAVRTLPSMAAGFFALSLRSHASSKLASAAVRAIPSAARSALSSWRLRATTSDREERPKEPKEERAAEAHGHQLVGAWATGSPSPTPSEDGGAAGAAQIETLALALSLGLAAASRKVSGVAVDEAVEEGDHPWHMHEGAETLEAVAEAAAETAAEAVEQAAAAAAAAG